jgi:predicted permease
MIRPKQLDEELDCELQFHLAQRADELIAQGVTPADAHRQAALLFGNRTALTGSARDRNILPWLETTLQDMRFAARTLRRDPGFTTAAVLSLGLGIGANTALFSLLDALLLKSLPVVEPQRLVRILPPSGSFGYQAFELLRTHTRLLSGVAATGRLPSTNIEEHGQTLPVSVQEVSGDYFDVLGVSAVRGRVFHAADAKSPDGAIAVISDPYWRARYGASLTALGARFRYQNHDFTVSGVAAPGFRGVVLDQPCDIWMPIEKAEGLNSMLLTKGAWLQVIGRLQDGVSASQASAEAAALLRRTIEVEPGGNGFSTLRGRFSRPLAVLECIVGLVLLIACANLANLMLAAASSRQREIAVRQALGAARGRLVRQMLTESLLVSFLGSVLAILVAEWLSHALLRFLPPNAASAQANLSFHLDARVLGFIAAIALLTALLFGLAPALRTTRPSLTPGLKQTGGSGRSGHWTSRGLVVGEVTLCTILLMAAALFVRSLGHLKNLDPGFVAENVLVADVDGQRLPHFSKLQMLQRMEALRAQVARLPGVQAVGYSHIRQLSGFAISSNIDAEGHVPEPGENKEAAALHISPGFLGAMGTPLLAGRDFTEHDNAGPEVAIVNESFSRQFFPGQSPVGRHFGIDGPSSSGTFEIVGVVRNTKWLDLRRDAPAMYYRSALQVGPGVASLAVRASGDLHAIGAAVQRIAHEIDPRLSLKDVVPFTEMRDRTLVIERMVAQVSAAFGALALIVACVGLYGVLAYGVARRTREIGVRMALGASRGGVQWMVLRESLLLLGLGFAIGVPAALAATRLVASMLFGLTPSDPVTMAASLLVMAGVSLAAAIVPARRAARVDPTVALRYD